MLLSMTGYGDARRQSETHSAQVEVRAVNNRYLKVVIKGPESCAALESGVEKLIRGAIGRGTINVNIRVENAAASGKYSIDGDVLAAYWRQLHTLSERLHSAGPADLGSLLPLPGVVSESSPSADQRDAIWPLIEGALTEAVEKLQQFRTTEGASMRNELQANVQTVIAQIDAVAVRAPGVVSDYRDKMLDRVRTLLQDGEATVEENDLIREVSVFADRCDVNEEITRLRSHVEQFAEFLAADESAGRKLEFLGQEMFREINTIGAKANDVAIALAVVEMKSAVEKMREILQNVE